MSEIKLSKQERRKIANDKIALVMKYFRENYYNLLKDKFLHTKSKMDAWVVASILGIESYSLTSFYKHYKSKDSYVSDLIGWYRIESIIKALEIEIKRLMNFMRTQLFISRNLMMSRQHKVIFTIRVDNYKK